MPAVDAPLYQIQRNVVLNRYNDTKQNYLAYTRPYKSTLSIAFQCVDFNPAGTDPVDSTMCHAKAASGQMLEWFSYGVGEPIPFLADGTQRIATESDTNVSKGRQTNGVETMIIEGLSASARSVRVQYASTLDLASAALTVTDPAVQNAYFGKTFLMDPAALIAPPQALSPFNYEQALFEAVKGHIAVEFEWDRSRIIKIGTLDEVPEGGAKSYLRASGVPSTDNRYFAPEGYVWERQGLPGSEFIARGRLVDNVVIPMNLVGLGGSSSITASSRLLRYVYLDITLRAHGLAVTFPTPN